MVNFISQIVDKSETKIKKEEPELVTPVNLNSVQKA